MNELDDLFGDETGAGNGLELISELVVAVTWLRRGAMPQLTVWHVLEQALRLEVGDDADFGEADPLGRVLAHAIWRNRAGTTEEMLTSAIRTWLSAVGNVYNTGLAWTGAA